MLFQCLHKAETITECALTSSSLGFLHPGPNSLETSLPKFCYSRKLSPHPPVKKDYWELMRGKMRPPLKKKDSSLDLLLLKLCQQ